MMADGLQPKQPDPINVPSGQPIQFHEMIADSQGYGLTLRFRFLAPQIADVRAASSVEALERDFAHLCETYALPRIANTGPQPAAIIISLAEREVPFGEATPDVTQIFEAYRLQDGACIWEGF